MRWLERLKWHRAAKIIARRLPQELAKGWGRAEYYTPGQVETAFKVLNLPDRYVVIAYANFLAREDFTAHAVKDSPMSYEVARVLVERYAKSIKSGNYAYDPVNNVEGIRGAGSVD